jgi:hypothetical protein
MLRAGISSVSYRNRKATDVIAAAKNARFAGVEWSSDTHVPPGDLRTAESIMMATLRAGLTVSAYGSYYRIGGGTAGFAPLLASARPPGAEHTRMGCASLGNSGPAPRPGRCRLGPRR